MLMRKLRTIFTKSLFLGKLNLTSPKHQQHLVVIYPLFEVSSRFIYFICISDTVVAFNWTLLQVCRAIYGENQLIGFSQKELNDILVLIIIYMPFLPHTIWRLYKIAYPFALPLMDTIHTNNGRSILTPFLHIIRGSVLKRCVENKRGK